MIITKLINNKIKLYYIHSNLFTIYIQTYIHPSLRQPKKQIKYLKNKNYNKKNNKFLID